MEQVHPGVLILVLVKRQEGVGLAKEEWVAPDQVQAQ